MERNTTCPRTGLECGGKAYLAEMLVGLVEGQISLDLSYMATDQAQATRAEALARLDGTRAALEKDLEAPCPGDLCGPLAHTASRFILGGPSHSEMLSQTPNGPST